MFVVEVGAALTTVFVIKDAASGGVGFSLGFRSPSGFWFTVLFANFAEAMAEARAKHKPTICVKRKQTPGNEDSAGRQIRHRCFSQLRSGDVVLVGAGNLIPGDGEVIEGIASVDESVITGESALFIRESGGDRSAVTGGTKVLSDHITVKITSNPGETFLDRMMLSSRDGCGRKHRTRSR